jgi:membrane-bound lytic murein transglycosylase B
VLLQTLSFLISVFTPVALPSWGSAPQPAPPAPARPAQHAGSAAAHASSAEALAQASGLSQQGFQDYLPDLRRRALAEGVRQETIDRIFPTLTFSARTVELDRQQPGGPPGSNRNPPFAPYLARHVTPALISRGRSRFAANAGQINAIGRRYGVDPAVMVAIWGKETGYGSIMGNFDLLNSLASLAYEGRRRDLFAGEFVATLKMVERGFPRSTLQGSWAGATGQSQFLPSVYIRLGVDGDGDGRADIWGSHLDALASIANYLSNAGWKPNVPWGVRVAVPSSLDRAAIANNLRAPRCARVFERHSRWLTMAEWRALGVVPTGPQRIPDDEMASLLEPDGPGQPGYLLTNNYRVILDYNCSNFYALTVALLAEGIAN